MQSPTGHKTLNEKGGEQIADQLYFRDQRLPYVVGYESYTFDISENLMVFPYALL